MTGTRRCCSARRAISPRRAISTAPCISSSSPPRRARRRRGDGRRTGCSSAFRATRSSACTTGRGSRSANSRSAPAPMMAGGAYFDIADHRPRRARRARPKPGSTRSSSRATSRRRCRRSSRAMCGRSTRGPQRHPDPRRRRLQRDPGARRVIRGTARAFSTETMSLIEDNMRRIAAGVAGGFGATAELDFRDPVPAAGQRRRRDRIHRRHCRRAGRRGQRQPRTATWSMASEDFSYMLNRRPGAYIQIGNGDGEGGCEVHNPGYDFNDGILPLRREPLRAARREKARARAGLIASGLLLLLPVQLAQLLAVELVGAVVAGLVGGAHARSARTRWRLSRGARLRDARSHRPAFARLLGVVGARWRLDCRAGAGGGGGIHGLRQGRRRQQGADKSGGGEKAGH